MSVLSLMMSSLHVNDLGKVLFVCERKNIIDRVPRFLILVLEGREAHFLFFLSFHGQIQQSQALSD